MIRGKMIGPTSWTTANTKKLARILNTIVVQLVKSGETMLKAVFERVTRCNKISVGIMAGSFSFSQYLVEKWITVSLLASRLFKHTNQREVVTLYGCIE